MISGSSCRSLAAAQWLASRPPAKSILAGPTASEARAAGDGRGIGLFAVKDIPQFSQILVDEPLVLMSPTEDLPELYLRFNRLSDADKKRYLSLSQRDDAARVAMLKDKLLQRGFERAELEQMATVANIMQNNAFNVDLGDGSGPSHRALFPNVARINHSCAPNAHVCFYPPNADISRGAMIVHALRDIRIGEEILISYFSILLPRSERQAKTQKWGFDCQCSVCTGSPDMERLRTSFRDFKGRQDRVIRGQGIVDEINASLVEARALAKQVKTTPEMSPALPELFDAIGTLEARNLAIKDDREGRKALLAALEDATLWEARITGQASPATSNKLKKLKGFAIERGDLSIPHVVGDHSGYSIEWS